MAITFDSLVGSLLIRPFDCAQIFSMVVIESLLGDEEVWSPKIEQRVKMAITFDPIVGLRSNICTSFWKPFSLGLLWNRNSVTRWSGRPDFKNGFKRP
jgi:hypothetical protein